MAAGRVTMTGLTQFQQGVAKLPRAMTLALRAVAFRASRRVHDQARAILLSKTDGTGATAAAIRTREHEDRQMFVVDVGPVPGRPANLPLWLEMGTVHMRARTFMRPALEAHSDAYIRESDEAVERTAQETLG